jgi:hypothetical protein
MILKLGKESVEVYTVKGMFQAKKNSTIRDTEE